MRTFLITVLSLLMLALGLCFYFTRRPGPLPGLDRSSFLPAAVPGHVTALTHDDAAARKRAAVALWQIGADAREATPALLTAARDPDAEVREAVVRALGHTARGVPDAVPVLADALRDPAQGVRVAAAASLAEVWSAGRAPAVGEPARGETSPQSGPRRRPPPTLGPVRLDPEATQAARRAIAPLTDLLEDADPRARANAASALAELGPLAEPAVERLARLAGKDPDEQARLQAAIALGNIGPPAKAAVPVLLDRLRNDPVDWIRANVAVALGMIRHDAPVVVPALVELFLREEFGDVRGAAVTGMRYFEADACLAVPLLRAAAMDPKYQQREQLVQDIRRLLSQLERNLPQESLPESRGGVKKG
jgi:HEAT repeat protein